jgi:hypothetical protein
MDLGSWQAGLVLGAAFTIVLDFGLRAILWRLRVRKKKQCTHCTGILGDDGRAEFPVERLECCAWCGDTWPEGIRPEYEAPLPGYRDSAADQIQALVRDLPPATKEGALVDLDAAFARLSGPDKQQLYGYGVQYGFFKPPPVHLKQMQALNPITGTRVLRPVPGPGKERFE